MELSELKLKFEIKENKKYKFEVINNTTIYNKLV